MNIDKYFKQDGYYDERGCLHEDAESFIMNGVFGFCGCVGRESIVIIVKTLEHFNTWTETGKYWNDLVQDVFNGVEGAAYITAELLEDKGMMEHGTAIRGAWLTDKGKEFLSDCNELIIKWGVGV